MIKVDAARETALKILYTIYEDKAYSNIALSNAFSKKETLSALDRAFITELVYGTLKYTIALDHMISLYSSVKLKKLSKWTHHLLRIALYQIFHMDKVPHSAACNESVKLAGKYGHEGTKKYVNGVLRAVIRKTEGIWARIEFPSVSVQYAYPQWLTNMLINMYGEAFTIEILKSSMQTPKVSLRVNTLKTSRDVLYESLQDSGISVSLSEISEDGLIVEKAAAITALPAFQQGLFYVQGESSMQVADILAPVPGNQVLDLCCAPGGKTTHLAARMQNKGRILAGDIYPHKLQKVQETAARLGIHIIETILQDAAIYEPSYEQAFDAVLADVPCSGTGIIRNRPEIKLNRDEKEIETLTQIQASILQNAGRYVKPGGILVYSTCSILKTENADQTAKFLKANPEFQPEGAFLSVFPQQGRDGFYIAKMRRRM